MRIRRGKYIANRGTHSVGPSAADAGYRIYGLTLQSPLLLPCPLIDRLGRPDVQLRRGTAVQFARAREEAGRSSRSDDWFQCRRLASGTTYLRWSGLSEFLVSPDGRRILYRQSATATAESFNIYLLGQILSFSLVAFGLEPLHGTAVVVDGSAVALLGDCGYGKSTLGAALLARGFPILTDDLVVLEQHNSAWTAHPGVPRLKLFPSVVRRLLGPGFGGTPMNGGTSKLVLSLGAEQTVGKVVPLKALYVLSDPRQRPSGGRCRVNIERLSGREAFLEIIRAAFNLLVLERQRFANQFAFARRLTASVPVRRLTYHRDLSDLPAVCDALLADVATASANA